MDVGMTPCTEGGPTIQNRTWVEDQLMIAEPRLYKNRKKKEKKTNIHLIYVLAYWRYNFILLTHWDEESWGISWTSCFKRRFWKKTSFYIS